MKHLKYFSEIYSKTNYCDITISYINDEISEQQFYSYLESGLINEGSVSFLSSVKDWFYKEVLSSLKTLLESVCKLGWKAFEKVMKFINWVSTKISKFQEKNPTLWKVIVVTIIMFICLVVFASEAKAAATGKPTDPSMINAAIGYIKDLDAKNHFQDQVLVKKAMLYLIDIRDGSQEIPKEMLSDQAKEMAESALKTVKELGKESGSEQSGFIKGISDFIKAGSEYTSGEIITDSRGDHVFLYTDTNRIFSTPK